MSQGKFVALGFGCWMGVATLVWAVECPIVLTDVTAATQIGFRHNDGSTGEYRIVEYVSAGSMTSGRRGSCSPTVKPTRSSCATANAASTSRCAPSTTWNATGRVWRSTPSSVAARSEPSPAWASSRAPWSSKAIASASPPGAMTKS